MRPSIRALVSETSGLGLEQDRVAVVDHDPVWSKLFAPLADDVRGALSSFGARVEHIGSSSVPGLAAKPILDVAVGLSSPIEIQAVVDSLTPVGLIYQGDLGDHGGLLFTLESSPGVVVVNLHVVDVDGFQWRWYLAFRDGLRSRPDLRQDYENLKRHLAMHYEGDRQGYTRAKFDWVFTTVNQLDRNHRRAGR